VLDYACFQRLFVSETFYGDNSTGVSAVAIPPSFETGDRRL